MKKYILILIALLFSMPSFAQLNVQKENSKIEKIGTLRSSYAWLYCQDSDYYLYIRTTNQFDDPTLFCLGETAESAVQTAQDMIDAIDTIEYKASLEVKDAKGVGAVLLKKKMVGLPYWEIFQETRAGSSNITPKELQTAITIIQSHAGVSSGKED